MTRVLVILLALAGVAGAHPAMDGKPCLACHPDAHHGEFAARPDGGACAGCHTTTGWSPSTFGVAQHATTKYVLDGKHVATPCSGCHPGAKPRTSFQVAGSECLDCHQNPHEQKFAAQQQQGGCAGCHTTFTWRSWKVDHKTWPLAGGHARAACTACHPGKTIASPVAELRGVARECVACHADRHAQQFARAPAKPCTACHDTNAWATPKFDHTKTTYPLDGVHVGMPCAQCHKTVELRNGDRVVAWRLGYAQCKDCHANPHPATSVDCKGCHAATSWKPTDGGGTGFDHDKTGFALRAAHAKASCTTCHDGKPKPAKADARTTSSCQSCHPDPHMGRMAGQCFECHTAVAWSDVAMFEQHRRTRMPLTGKHAVIECGACHRRQGERPWRDLPADCFGCHAKQYGTATNHNGQSGEAPYSRACAACHVTTGWTPALDPDAVMRQLAKRQDHDRVFALTTGSHRTATCDQCHADPKRQRLVRCDGCHAAEALRTQHGQPVAPAAATCLRCHPRGARR